jgi:lipoate-protein ligase A
MRLLDLVLPTAAENVALDEALLLEAEAGTGGETLRFWELPDPAVVLGAGGVVADDVDDDACRADGVIVLRRASGGGTVLLGPGCLLFTLVLRTDRTPELAAINASYRYILGRTLAALNGLLPGMSQAGVSDMTADGRKWSGNAQQRKRDHILHHGSLLYGFDLSRVGRYLRKPPKQPDYRGNRGHDDFLMNLPATADDLKRRLRVAWGADETTADWPADRVAELVAEKYGRDEWNRRR